MSLHSLVLPNQAREAVNPRLSAITRERLFAVVSPLALLIIWECLSRLHILDPRIFSSPTAVAALAAQMLLDGELVRDTAATTARLVLGMVAGVIPGLFLGLTMGLFRTPRAIIQPLVSLIYPLPRVALFPLVFLVVGLNETSNVLMVALGPFFTMLIGTMAAVINVEPIFLGVARSFKCGGGGVSYDRQRPRLSDLAFLADSVARSIHGRARDRGLTWIHPVSRARRGGAAGSALGSTQLTMRMSFISRKGGLSGAFA